MMPLSKNCASLVKFTPPPPSNRSPGKIIAFGCLALSMSLVGIYVALSKPLATALPVFLLGWLRFGIGVVAMARWLKKPADEAPMSAQTKRLVFLESLLGNFLFSVCMLYGVSLTSAVSAGVIMSTIPATVACLSWLFLREKTTLRVWAAVACGVAGIGLLSLSKQELTIEYPRGLDVNSIHARAMWGHLLLIGAVLCEASYAVIGKKLTGVLGAKRIASLINVWGFALMTPFGLYLAKDFNFAGVTLGIWLLLLFYALAASVWTVWLWMTGLKTVPASQAGVFTVMLPVSAALTGVLILGESLGVTQMAALGVALTGVLLATLPSRNSKT